MPPRWCPAPLTSPPPHRPSPPPTRPPPAPLPAVGHDTPVAWIRLAAYPDGGLSRVRVIGGIDRAARRLAGYRWFNSLPQSQATSCLADAGMAADLAAGIASQRPLPERWLGDLAHDSPGQSGGGHAQLSPLAPLPAGQPGGARGY